MKSNTSIFVLGAFILSTGVGLAYEVKTPIETPIEREESNDPVAPEVYVDNPLLDEFPVKPQGKTDKAPVEVKKNSSSQDQQEKSK